MARGPFSLHPMDRTVARQVFVGEVQETLVETVVALEGEVVVALEGVLVAALQGPGYLHVLLPLHRPCLRLLPDAACHLSGCSARLC